MDNPLIAATDPPQRPPALDYTGLRQEGIELIACLAGKRWTDFNSHDPGITILEALCYALTDFGYRINYDMRDLLASTEGDPYLSLFSPGKILTSNPVTATDLRKLMIDLDGVRNAWIEEMQTPEPALFHDPARNEVGLQENDVTATKIALKGLYRVLIEKSDAEDIEGREIDRQEIERKAARLLHAHRGLGEDFEEIRVLDGQDIQVHARLEIAPVEDPSELLAIIYQKIAAYCSPGVPFYTLEQMLERGRRVDEIFEGPVLQHGFIDADELAQLKRRSALRVSDLIHELMGVPGVLAVQSIRLATGNQTQDWLLKLDLSRTPRFDPVGSRIDLIRNQTGEKVSLSNMIVAEIKDNALAAVYQRARKLPGRDLRPPIGRDRNVGNYYSLQHHFPSVYGIGAAGLPESATPERKARARQLKGYLLFYDQVLANCFAQLEHAGQLFSFYGDSSQTYFSQAVGGDPGLRLDELRNTSLEDHRRWLQEITESEVESGLSSRHHRFLNHLLARFAEQLTDCSPEDKQAFLRQYPRISSARGTAMNSLESAAPDNLSGLEQRLKFKLGLHAQEEQFYVVEHILLRPMEKDTRGPGPLFGSAGSQDPYSLQISFVFPAWPNRFQNPDFKQFTTQTIREETPAHLTCYVHWLNQADMRTFAAAYDAWLEHRRNYWKTQVGL
jgi:hypothetical protein